MNDSMVWDADDFGVNHIISDVCQSHDCRDKLDEFHYLNPNFKATLFAIPGEMTYELAKWCKENNSWIELAVHGILHSSNYECEKMTYEEFDNALRPLQPMLDTYFVKGFKAPGWQISNDIYKWLDNHGWWIADQGYNNSRRPHKIPTYINYDGKFEAHIDENHHEDIDGKHYHTWNVGAVGNAPNGVYEASEEIKQTIQGVHEFKFISEVLAV